MMLRLCAVTLLLLACVTDREPATGFASRCFSPANLERRGPCEPEALTGRSVRPNIVLILTDDQRGDLMAYMPLTDSILGPETVRFSRAFATTSLCCPARASILTGLYAHNTGVTWNNPPNGGATVFNPTSTVATWLQSAGYRTSLVGKYMNAYQLLNGAVPPGWSDWRVFDDPHYYNYVLSENGTFVSYGGAAADYSTVRLLSKAQAFLAATPDSVPVYLHFAPNAPHRPFTPYPSDVGSYSGFPPWRPASFNEANVSDKPAWVRALPSISTAQRTTSDGYHRGQIETLQAVDRAVRDLVVALQADGRWSNTLLVFASDNGFMWGEHRIVDRKHCPYEECIHVPLWVRVPGAVARTDTNLVALMDLAPTFMAWAGVPVGGPVNGLDLLPLIANPATPWRTDLLIEHRGTPTLNEQSDGVRTHQYYYGEYATTGERELYDLVADPLELVNRASNPAYASIVASLSARLAVLRQE